MPRLSSPARSRNAAGFTLQPMELSFMQMVQLQRVTFVTSSSTSKRTALQWQLPVWVFMKSTMVALDDSLMSVLSGMRLAAFSRMEPNEVIDEVLASDIVDDPTRSPALEPAKAAATARRRRAWGKHASLAAVTLGAVGGFVA